jgi:membrane-associated phospholipid phosphatase
MHSDREVPAARSVANAIAFALLLICGATLALNPDWVDRPLAKAVNNLTRDQGLANELALGITYPTLQGLIVVSLVWYCWFSSADQSRARIVGGTFAAVSAALIARLLQHALPTSPKPIFDPLLEIHVPAVLGDLEALRATSFPRSHTFPSPRATLFAGLAIGIYVVQPRLGLLALSCTAAAELSRIYLGLHYPSDMVGSFGLAAAMVWILQIQWALRLGLLFVRWERCSSPIFYMCAFVASYLMATTFEDLRNLAAHVL